MRPATPAAASRWPMFVLTAPRAHGAGEPPMRVGEGVELDGVAQRRAGAVRLDRADVAGRPARQRQGAADQRRLGRAVGGGDAVAAAVLVRRGRLDDGADRVAVAQGGGERLEDDDAAALAADVAVRRGVERLAAGVRREHVGAGQRLGDVGRQDQVDAAREGQVAVAREQALAGEVDRRQRRRAGRIDRQARPAQVEVVRQPMRRHAAGVADAQVGVRAGVGEQEPAVVVAGDADEHAGPRPGQPVGGDGRVLEGVVGDLEQERGAAGRCTTPRAPAMREERRVERPHLVEVARLRPSSRGGSRPGGPRAGRGRRTRPRGAVPRTPRRRRPPAGGSRCR